MAVKTLSSFFTRPNNATDYADNDLVANSATAGSVTPLKWFIGPRGGTITRITIRKSDGSDVANADFSLRLFEASPTVANGDNGAISHDYAGHLATIDVGAMVAGTDDGYVFINAGATDMPAGLDVATAYVFGLLEANAAYVPAANEVFTVYLTVAYDL